MGSLLKGESSKRLYGGLSNEWGRLSQGNDHGIKGTDTLVYIQNKDIQKDRKTIYGSFVCDYRPLKDEKWKVRLVVGVKKLSYELDAGSPAANILETKILANSVISDARKGAQFLSCDLKYFFLAMPMARPKYMKIVWKYFPPDIIIRYNLQEIRSSDGYIYCKIQKGMYGLNQAAVLAYEQLAAHLQTGGFQKLQDLWGCGHIQLKTCLSASVLMILV